MPFQPFDASAETHIHRQTLPHWRQWGTTYFVTTRLADSLPTRIVEAWRQKRDAWLQARGISHVEDLADELQIDYHREFTERFHQLLDAGHGECVLARQACADLLIERLLAGHPKAYRLDAWCVMPNHLHALVQPLQPTVLGEILRHWKGGSARDINLKIQRQGPLWLRETFDHIVRSQAQLDHFRRYINNNPKQAGLKAGFVVGFGRELLQRQHAQ